MTPRSEACPHASCPKNHKENADADGNGGWVQEKLVQSEQENEYSERHA